MTDPSADAVPAARATSAARPRRGAWLALIVGAAVVLVGASTVLVGPRPKPVDAGLPKAPPPLALPNGVAARSATGRAAALLATDDLDAARAAFTTIVAEDPDGEVGQVGLVLSRWRMTGPISVERDLRQLAREYPDSAYVLLHLGLVQLLVGEDRAARATLRDAEEAGGRAGDPTSLRMARLADDLLHPGAFRGALPVLVRVDEVRGDDARLLRLLLAAVGRDDRPRVVALARRVDRSADPMARVAAAAALFDKDDPEATVQRLQAVARGARREPAAADRARLHATLAQLWGGGERADGCAGLEASSGPGVDAATSRIAEPIRAELCAVS